MEALEVRDLSTKLSHLAPEKAALKGGQAHCGLVLGLLREAEISEKVNVLQGFISGRAGLCNQLWVGVRVGIWKSFPRCI